MISHLRLQRERRGWSQATLAKVLGTTVATVAKWEESLSIPPPSIQEVLHLLFGTDDNAFAIHTSSTEWDGKCITEVFEHASEAADATPHQGLAFLLLPHAPLLCPHHMRDLMG